MLERIECMNCILCNDKLSNRLSLSDFIKIKTGKNILSIDGSEEYKLGPVFTIIFSLYYGALFPPLLVIFAIYAFVYPFLQDLIENTIGFLTTFFISLVLTIFFYIILEYLITLIVPLKKI